MAGDCVVFCHYIAINVVVGAAQEDDQVVVFSPDNASVTTIRTVARGLQMVELGRTANTQVN
jgi:hypothetical protein